LSNFGLRIYYPLTLLSPSGWRGEKEDEKIKTMPPHPTHYRGVKREKEQNFLKTPLTLVLSRKGREEMEGKNLKAPLTLALSREVEREEGR
jgi:hypothetical protein